MNIKRLCRFSLPGFFGLVLASAVGLAGQATPGNLHKEVVDRKARIAWRNAPQNSLPAEMCTILQGCAGAPDRVIALPPVTEAGKRVARGLFLSRSTTGTRADLVILSNQTPTEAYFFALNADGTLQRAAYWTTGKPWVQIGTALARPVFEKDKQVWLDHLAKLGAAPAAAPTSSSS
jgi:hypothetical protein